VIDKEKITKPKDFLREMRALLNNYPMKINFREGEDTLSVIGNVLVIYDLLTYCKNKTNDEVVKKKFELELKEMNKNLNLKELRRHYRQTIGQALHFNRHRLVRWLEEILIEKSAFIYGKLQYYILAIPQKGKFNMHVRSAHGLPAAFAEDYEREEIEEGATIKEDQPFKIDEEGKIIPLD